MGIFSVRLEVGCPGGRGFLAVEAVVDAGSSYTVLGEDLLADLGVCASERQQFQLGDGRMVEYDMGEVRLRLAGREFSSPVVSGPVGFGALLGAVSLRIFGLVADSVNDRLIPMPPIRVRPL